MAHRIRAGAALAALGMGALAPGAYGSDRAELGVTLGTQTPGAPTSLAFRVLYKRPGDPGGKPPALTRAAFKLPPGTRFDTRATPTCHATNQELQALGRAACPPASIIGTGSLTAITGFGPPADPFEGDLTAFNGGTELIELVTVKGSNAGAGIDRLTIEGSTLRAHTPEHAGRSSRRQDGHPRSAPERPRPREAGDRAAELPGGRDVDLGRRVRLR